MRAFLVLALLGSVACKGPEDKKKVHKVENDTGDPGQFPPTSCPVGDLAITRGQIAADELMLERWNELRETSGNCAGTVMDPKPALLMDEALMWVARCWAYDLSILGGPPPESNQFSDGTPIQQTAAAMGYDGFLHTWAVGGNVNDPSDAFDMWLDGGGSTCESLWADGTTGAAAWSDAGDLLVAVRLTAIDAR